MKVTVIIPSRYGSSRLEGKPLADIVGKPMIQHVYERASEASGVDDVLVATDDERIFSAVEGFGGKVVMTSPEHQTGTDRLAEVAASLDSDIIVNVQGDEPLIGPRMIEAAVAPLLKDRSIKMGTLKTVLCNKEDLHDSAVAKLVVDKDDFALYFSRSPIPFLREDGEAASDTVYYKHIGLYVYDREFLLNYAKMPQTPLEKAERLEQLRALENGYRIKAVTTEEGSIGVDTPEGLEKVRALITKRMENSNG